MSVVYKAEDTSLSRIMALKLLPAYLSCDEEICTRLKREAKAPW